MSPDEIIASYPSVPDARIGIPKSLHKLDHMVEYCRYTHTPLPDYRSMDDQMGLREMQRVQGLVCSLGRDALAVYRVLGRTHRRIRTCANGILKSLKMECPIGWKPCKSAVDKALRQLRDAGLVEYIQMRNGKVGVGWVVRLKERSQWPTPYNRDGRVLEEIKADPGYRPHQGRQIPQNKLRMSGCRERKPKNFILDPLTGEVIEKKTGCILFIYDHRFCAGWEVVSFLGRNAPQLCTGHGTLRSTLYRCIGGKLIRTPHPRKRGSSGTKVPRPPFFNKAESFWKEVPVEELGGITTDPESISGESINSISPEENETTPDTASISPEENDNSAALEPSPEELEYDRKMAIKNASMVQSKVSQKYRYDTVRSPHPAAYTDDLVQEWWWHSKEGRLFMELTEDYHCKNMELARKLMRRMHRNKGRRDYANLIRLQWTDRYAAERGVMLNENAACSVKPWKEKDFNGISKEAWRCYHSGMMQMQVKKYMEMLQRNAANAHVLGAELHGIASAMKDSGEHLRCERAGWLPDTSFFHEAEATKWLALCMVCANSGRTDYLAKLHAVSGRWMLYAIMRSKHGTGISACEFELGQEALLEKWFGVDTEFLLAEDERADLEKSDALRCEWKKTKKERICQPTRRTKTFTSVEYTTLPRMAA